RRDVGDLLEDAGAEDVAVARNDRHDHGPSAAERPVDLVVHPDVRVGLRELIRVADAEPQAQRADAHEGGDREHRQGERPGVAGDQLGPAAKRAQASPPTNAAGQTMPALTYGRSPVPVNS